MPRDHAARGSPTAPGTPASPRERARSAATASSGRQIPPREKADDVSTGRVSCSLPGFIDIHNHSTDGLARDPLAETQVSQGITTLVVGADGGSPWPIADYLEKRRSDPAGGQRHDAWSATRRSGDRSWATDYRRRCHAGRGRARWPRSSSRACAKAPSGLSSGLEYEVGSYSATEELVELSRAAARHGGFYMTHIRDEADKSFEAFEEAIAIGERARDPGPDLAHQAGHGGRVGQARGGDRPHRGGAGRAAST